MVSAYPSLTFSIRGKKKDWSPIQDWQDNMTFHHVTQESTQFKTHNVFISRICHKYFWTVIDHEQLKLPNLHSRDRHTTECNMSVSVRILSENTCVLKVMWHPIM